MCQCPVASTFKGLVDTAHRSVGKASCRLQPYDCRVHLILLCRAPSLACIGSHVSPKWQLLQLRDYCSGAKYAAVHVLKCVACAAICKFVCKCIKRAWNKCPITVF